MLDELCRKMTNFIEIRDMLERASSRETMLHYSNWKNEFELQELRNKETQNQADHQRPSQEN